MCNINGKPMPQVLGCVIECYEGVDMAKTTSIVRDGKTSVASFIAPYETSGGGSFIIPDIAKALGILKAHNGNITLIQKEDKLVFKSTNKQTTISADPRALAFPHTKKSVKLWSDESLERMSCINTNGEYTMASGEIRKPSAHFQISGSDLRDAINSGNINGQKVNRCTLEWDGDRLTLEVGNDLLGKTKTCLLSTEPEFDPFKFEFEGGLENCIDNGDCNLYILDFNPEGQGYSMLIYTNYSKIFQRGVV